MFVNDIPTFEISDTFPLYINLKDPKHPKVGRRPIKTSLTIKGTVYSLVDVFNTESEQTAYQQFIEHIHPDYQDQLRIEPVKSVDNQHVLNDVWGIYVNEEKAKETGVHQYLSTELAIMSCLRMGRYHRISSQQEYDAVFNENCINTISGVLLTQLTPDAEYSWICPWMLMGIHDPYFYWMPMAPYCPEVLSTATQTVTADKTITHPNTQIFALNGQDLLIELYRNPEQASLSLLWITPSEEFKAKLIETNKYYRQFPIELIRIDN